MFVISIFVILMTVFAHSEAQLRIVGGKPAKRGELPYQAFLYFLNQTTTNGNGTGKAFKCSGTLISNEYILTAAHCATSKSELLNSAVVILGIVDRKSNDTGREWIDVPKNNFIIHPNYNTNSKLENDIALIKLPKPVEFSNYIQIAKLPSHYQTEEELLNKTIVTSGWGRLRDSDERTSDILHYMKTKVVDGVECNKLSEYLIPYNRSYQFQSNTQICINSPSSTTCHGDSGGPNVLKENGTNIVVGVSSWGLPSCDPNTAQVLTKVSYYLEWISNNTGINV